LSAAVSLALFFLPSKDERLGFLGLCIALLQLPASDNSLILRFARLPTCTKNSSIRHFLLNALINSGPSLHTFLTFCFCFEEEYGLSFSGYRFRISVVSSSVMGLLKATRFFFGLAGERMLETSDALSGSDELLSFLELTGGSLM